MNSWLEGSLLSITTVSFILQIYVFFIVIYASPQAVRAYRLFIILYTFWDLLFTFAIGFLVDPEIPAVALNIGHYIRGLGKYFGPTGGNISIAFCVFCGVGIVLAQDYALMYRFLAVQSSKVPIRYMLHPVCVVVVNGIFFLTEFGIALKAYYCFTAPKDFSRVLADKPEILENIKNGTVFFHIRFTNFTIIYVIGISFVFQQIYTIAVCYGIFHTLNKFSFSFSAKTYKMHKHLTNLLIFQLSTPIIFVMVPISLEIAAMILKYEFSKVSVGLGVLMLSLYASSNSILTIFCIKPYRNFTLAWLSKMVAFPVNKLFVKDVKGINIMSRIV